MSSEDFYLNIMKLQAGEIKPDPDYPNYICLDCGHKYGKMPHGHIYTCHEGHCDVCGEIKTVTEPRDFGYPKVKKRKP